jgi:acetoacetyl-CoA synthetase
MWRFLRFVNQKYDQSLNDYTSLYQWSINDLQAFWSTVWEFVEIKASETYFEVIDNVNKMPGARWFSGALLNFA